MLIRWASVALVSIFLVAFLPQDALAKDLKRQISDEAKGDVLKDQPKGKLVIVSSYPKVLTDEFRRAFEKLYPQVTVDVLRKKTGAGVDYLVQTQDQNIVDLFWVSAPDAMETLKQHQLLSPFVYRSPGVPSSVSGYPANDPEGFYTGFAASGYGVMWNERYIDAKQLTAPVDWDVLASPAYFGHVGMSSPSRSGTTHLAVESMLQGLGWQQGWQLARSIGGNVSRITKKSSHVPKGVETGEFAAGIVIDFYGLGSRARRYPVNFAYPEVTSVVPASIALVSQAPNPKAAKAFVEFLLSEYGQSLLLEPEIRRLPLRPEIYDRAPDEYPNPFKDDALKEKQVFDVRLSAQRYAVVNALFDVMVTFNIDELKAATRSLHLLRSELDETSSEAQGEARRLLLQSEALLNFIPISESVARSERTVSVFTKKRKKADDALGPEQAKLELGWQEDIRANYVQAKDLAEAARALLR